jgi:hypothetical protein
MLKRSIAWFFAQPQPPIRGWRVVAWWELRRIPFNLIIAVYGIICLVVFYWGILGTGILQLRPGEDAVEPMTLIATPLAANICYTFGWLVELPARLFVPALSPSFGPWMLRLGLGLSAILISIPAVFWGGYRVLQLAHVLH